MTTAFERDGYGFASVFLKALEAMRDYPLDDRLAMASVLTVMAGAPLHAATDEIGKRAATVVPLFAAVMRRIARNEDISAETMDMLFHEFYSEPRVSRKFMAKIWSGLLMYATTAPHGG